MLSIPRCPSSRALEFGASSRLPRCAAERAGAPSSSRLRAHVSHTPAPALLQVPSAVQPDAGMKAVPRKEPLAGVKDQKK